MNEIIKKEHIDSSDNIFNYNSINIVNSDSEFLQSFTLPKISDITDITINKTTDAVLVINLNDGSYSVQRDIENGLKIYDIEDKSIAMYFYFNYWKILWPWLTYLIKNIDENAIKNLTIPVIDNVSFYMNFIPRLYPIDKIALIKYNKNEDIIRIKTRGTIYTIGTNTGKLYIAPPQIIKNSFNNLSPPPNFRGIKRDCIIYLSNSDKNLPEEYSNFGRIKKLSENDLINMSFEIIIRTFRYAILVIFDEMFEHEYLDIIFFCHPDTVVIDINKNKKYIYNIIMMSCYSIKYIILNNDRYISNPEFINHIKKLISM